MLLCTEYSLVTLSCTKEYSLVTLSYTTLLSVDNVYLLDSLTTTTKLKIVTYAQQ